MFLKINKTVVKNDDSNLSQNTKKTSNTSSEKEGNITESNVKNESKFIQAKPSKSKKKKKFKPNISKETESVNKIDKNNPESTEKTIQSETNDIDQSQLNIIMLKPPPKLVEQLLTFLSEDLIKKTLEVFIYIYFILNKSTNNNLIFIPRVETYFKTGFNNKKKVLGLKSKPFFKKIELVLNACFFFFITEVDLKKSEKKFKGI